MRWYDVGSLQYMIRIRNSRLLGAASLRVLTAAGLWVLILSACDGPLSHSFDAETEPETQPKPAREEIFGELKRFDRDFPSESMLELDEDEIIDALGTDLDLFLTTSDDTLFWDPIPDHVSPDEYQVAVFDLQADSLEIFETNKPEFELSELGGPAIFLFGVRQRRVGGEWSEWINSIDDPLEDELGWYALHEPTKNAPIEAYITFEEEIGNSYVDDPNLKDAIESEWRERELKNFELGVLIDLNDPSMNPH